MPRLKAVPARAALALVSVLPMFGVERALADACANNECGPGYVCESNTGVSCYPSCYLDAGFDAGGTARDAGVPSAPLPAPGASVDAGKPRPADGGLDSCWTNPICQPYEYHYCNAAPCTADSDCPSSMVCHADSWWECSSSGCKPGGDCDADGGTYSVDGGSSTCTEHSENRCTPRINLPCHADADCGEGYECEESRWYGCSGGGGVSPDGDGGFVFHDAGSDCQWYSNSYCKVLEVPCESDSECSNGLRCRPHYDYSQCYTDAAVADADGGRPVCEPVLTGNTCQYWYDYDAGTGYDASVPPGGIGGSTGGSTGGGALPGGGGGPGGGVGGGTPSRDAGSSSSTDAGDADEEDDDGHHGNHGGGLLKRLLHHLFGQGGCSVPGNAAQGNLAWFGLLGLGLLARRRRG